MPSSIQAHLLYAGHGCQIGETLTLTENWISHNLRPDLSTSEYLPDIGDNPIATNQISAQSIIANSLTRLTVRSITETDYLEGSVRGTLYTVLYTDSVAEAEFTEPTDDPTTVVLSISASAQVDTYTKDPGDLKAQKLYVKNGATPVETKNISINKITALINVQTTKRYKDKTATQVIVMGQDAGKINTSTMWGVPAGMILYHGHTATPQQEVVNEVVKITWNITHNYSIKYIPGLQTVADTWDYVFYQGVYSKLYTDAACTTVLPLYTRGTLPNDLAP